MQRILLVEDDIGIVCFLEEFLSGEILTLYLFQGSGPLRRSLRKPHLICFLSIFPFQTEAATEFAQQQKS